MPLPHLGLLNLRVFAPLHPTPNIAEAGGWPRVVPLTRKLLGLLQRLYYPHDDQPEQGLGEGERKFF